MSRALTSLLLLGSLLFAQQATAQFDYNSTLLGTVSTFINVSTIPGDWRSLTCTSHAFDCPGCLCGQQLRITALAHAHLTAHMPHIYSIQSTSPLKHYEYELYCFLTVQHTARVIRHSASLGSSSSRAADFAHVHIYASQAEALQLAAELRRPSTDPYICCAAYAGGNNFLFDNYNAEMITKKSAQMYCQTGSPSFPVVEATIQSAHNVGHDSLAVACLTRILLAS